MMKKLLIFSFIISILVVLSACGSGGTPIPPGPFPTSTVQAPDDIIFTPGSGDYRANIVTDNVTNPWPPVPVAVQDWTKGKDTISVLYRTVIDSRPGESHNDMILAAGDDSSGKTVYKLMLYAVGVPRGITLTDAGGDLDRPGVTGTVLVVTASPQMAAGLYTFNIGIKLNGKDFGTVPCTENVTP